MPSCRFRHDPEPLPRPAPVGYGSAFAAVAGATLLSAAPEPAPPGAAPAGARRRASLRTWRFTALPAPDGPAVDGRERIVAAPHCWSRAEADLADHKGPARYRAPVDPGTVPGARHHVVFPQLDYLAAVAVEGSAPVHHEGGFTPVLLDLPHDGGPVTVDVWVDDPVEAGLLTGDPLVAAKRKVKGVFEFHDSRPGGMLQGVHWDERFARRFGTGGMTGIPELVGTGDVRLDAVFVHGGPATGLRANWVLTNLGETTVDAVVVASFAWPTGRLDAVQVAARLAPGSWRLAVAAEPQAGEGDRWMPHAVGSSPGRMVVVRSDVVVAGQVSDASTVRFGWRDAAVTLTPGAPFELTVNGQRRYHRALNHIPGVWMAELDEELCRTDVALAVVAGADSLGPHAHVLPARFYDACDQAGMLVFQDFPLNLGTDPTGGPLVAAGPTMVEACRHLAAEAAYLLFNHPSVVYWCAHNEPAYQLAEAFSASDHPILVDLTARLRTVPDEEALDAAIVDVWRHVDPTRAAFPASGLGRQREVGDTHTYSGSLSADPVTTIAGVEASFVSEFGAWFPNFSAARPGGAVGARGDWPEPAGAEADWEHRTHIWASNAMRAGRPERSGSFPEWAWAGQLHAAVFAKLGIEAFRRRRWDPSRGHRWHLFVDHWGDAGAGLLDRHRSPQLPFWAVAAAHRPLLQVLEAPPSNRVPPGSVRLRRWLVDDRPRPGGPVSVSWSLRSLSPEETALVGVDDPGVEQAFGRPDPPAGDLVVVPLGPGSAVPGASGVDVVDVDPATGVAELPPLDLDLAEGRWAVLLGAEAAGTVVDNWGCFVAAPPLWAPAPGLERPPRFRLRTATGGEPVRVVRRWTGDTVAAATGADLDERLPPDQYDVAWAARRIPVDLYGDVTVDVATASAVPDGDLPWPFRA